MREMNRDMVAKCTLEFCPRDSKQVLEMWATSVSRVFNDSSYMDQFFKSSYVRHGLSEMESTRAMFQWFNAEVWPRLKSMESAQTDIERKERG